MAPALDSALRWFLAKVVTETFLPLADLLSRETVESFSTEITKLPPTPTLPPAAEASAAIFRVRLLSARMAMSLLARRATGWWPSLASVLAPDTPRARTGVTEMPPAEPALAETRLLSAVLASMVTEPIPSGVRLLMATPSSTQARVSTPVTETAMLAPTPREVPWPLAEPSASFSKEVSAVALMFSPPEPRVKSALFSTNARVLAEPTRTVTAPPTPMEASL